MPNNADCNKNRKTKQQEDCPGRSAGAIQPRPMENKKMNETKKPNQGFDLDFVIEGNVTYDPLCDFQPQYYFTVNGKQIMECPENLDYALGVALMNWLQVHADQGDISGGE